MGRRRDNGKIFELTPSEQEVGKLLNDGLSKAEICLKLGKNYRIVTSIIATLNDKQRALAGEKK